MRWIVMDIVVLSKDRVVDVTREPNGMTRPLDMPPYTYETQAEAEEAARRFAGVAIPESAFGIFPRLSEEIVKRVAE